MIPTVRKETVLPLFLCCSRFSFFPMKHVLKGVFFLFFYIEFLFEIFLYNSSLPPPDNSQNEGDHVRPTPPSAHQDGVKDDGFPGISSYKHEFFFSPLTQRSAMKSVHPPESPRIHAVSPLLFLANPIATTIHRGSFPSLFW